MRKVIFYCVSYGVDTRHLWEGKVFDRLKDAKKFTIGMDCFELIRCERDNGLSCHGTNKVLKEKIK